MSKFTRYPTARKEHKCAYANHNILPGERYTDEIYPPWTMTTDDPECAPFPIGEWYHERYHFNCYYAMYDYGYGE